MSQWTVLAAETSGGQAIPVAGPADLMAFGAGSVLVVMGAPGPNDFARWAAPIGLAAIRGAHIVRSDS